MVRTVWSRNVSLMVCCSSLSVCGSTLAVASSIQSTCTGQSGVSGAERSPASRPAVCVCGHLGPGQQSSGQTQQLPLAHREASPSFSDLGVQTT